jgi:hypothetical protein
MLTAQQKEIVKTDRLINKGGENGEPSTTQKKLYLLRTG